ncbi:bpX6 domain-containing protein, partial [Armatimonas sp.]|uniref:bpX6 domain-containing protein n=1 Tax=Armatimonas sp. TaxID=1872638 RepID=UPI003751E1C1
MIPEKLLHRGTITAAAFLFDTALLSEDEAQKRILALWEPGVRVWQTEDGALLATLATPKEVSTDSVPGLPLVRSRGHLLALPLTKTEWDELRPAPESLIYAQRGHITVLALAELEPVEPADWLALEGIVFIATRPLVEPVPVTQSIITEALTPIKAREIVGINPVTAAARAALLRSLNQPPPPAQKAPMNAAPSSGISQALECWGRVLLDRLRPPATGTKNTTDKLGDTIQEQVFSPGQLEAISRQNAEFLQKMLELFEKGQWQEALQHAIPLGKAGESDDTPLGMCFLHPRDQLVISPTRARAASSLPWEGLHGGFKQLYREAVERLKNEGRFEEAAYVLA